MRDLARSALTRIVATRLRSGDARVELLELPWAEDRLGCDWHPNAEMQRILAERLAAALRAKFARP